MDGWYHITVRGVLSERFCRGLGGSARPAGPGRTRLVAPRGGPCALSALLARLDNLGVEVIDVRSRPDVSSEREEHSP